MNLRASLRNVACVLLLTMVPGCIISTGSSREAYEPCDSLDTCQAGTSCQATRVTTTGAQGAQCTRSCTTSNDCPSDPNGGGVSCVNFSDGTTQCYRACDLITNNCPNGYSCADVSGTNICVPD